MGSGEIVKYVPFRRRVLLDALMPNYSDIYAVQSDLPDLVYAISDGLFALIKPTGAVYTELENTPKMAALMIEPVKAEIMAIYTEIMEYGFNHNLMGKAERRQGHESGGSNRATNKRPRGKVRRKQSNGRGKHDRGS